MNFLLDAPSKLVIGSKNFDLSHRALVMGIVNRTPDSFFDQGRYFALGDCLAHAEELVDAGADVIDVGGVKAGPGPEVSLTEELDRVIPVIAAIASRFDVAVSVDTWRAEVAKEAFAVGATLGNDISGFRDERYLGYAAQANAAVVATHIRLAPRIADPTPTYPDGVLPAVVSFLLERRDRALAAGIPNESIVFDAGLDLGKTAEQSVELLRCSDKIAALGQPVLLSASNKTFLRAICSLGEGDRRPASLAASTLGYLRGCRIMRVHDVVGTRRVVDVLAQVAEA